MQKRDLKFYKKISAALVLMLLCANVFARSGMFWGEKNLLVAKTRWFDIIYPERCEASAAILFEKADGVYEEVTAQYGLTPAFRMPVVITPAVEQFNAFWTAVPYNHIALYDTGLSGSSELAVFSETLLSTFRHELTHAVTYNMKDENWRRTGMIYGDCVVPGMLTVTTGMAEGATVTSESAAGEGRLNDEFAKHYVKQAKIEDKFPSYHDVSGASDVAPGGAPYFFNGAFHQWLQDNYGMEPYAQFWFRVVNMKNFTIAGAFKKAYGIKLRAAWKQFEEDYEVPDVPADPVSAGIVRDFFEPDSKEYSINNNAGSLYASLSSADAAKNSAPLLVWLDYFGGRVYAANPEPRKLFSMRGIDTVRVSNDGRFIAAAYTSDNSPGTTARVKIYDFESKNLFTVEETGLKEAAIIRDSSTYYLIAQKYAAQHYSISISKINLSANGRRIESVVPYAETVMGLETNPYAFVPLNDGTFAYLKKQKLQYSLCISSTDGQLLKEYEFPAGMVVRSLSYGEGSFCFSYAEKGTLPRLGIMNAESGALRLSDEDISGGVFEPVLYKGEVVYIGEFYRQNRILCMDVARGEAESAGVAVSELSAWNEIETAAGEDETTATISLDALAASSKKYNALPYLTRGIFLPVSSYQTEYFGINADYASPVSTSFLGITYITANPWTEGSSDLYTLTAGYNAASNAVGADLQIAKGTSTSLFSSLTDLKSEFDSKGWKQSGGTLTLSTNLCFGRFSTISLSNAAKGYLGKQDTRFPEKYSDVSSDDYKSMPTVAFWDKDTLGIAAPSDNTLYYMLQDIVSLSYSNIHRSGPGRFEYAGFGAGVSFGSRYDSELDNREKEYMKATALGAEARLYIPRLLPFESKYGFTYNFPVRFSGSLFPSDSIYGYTYPESSPGRVVFDSTAEATLFSMDIQHALPGITAVYLNDFYFAAGYACTGTAGDASEQGFQNEYLEKYLKSLVNGDGYFLDSIYLKAVLELTPNVGLFAKSAYKTGLVTTYSYTIRSTDSVKPENRIKYSVGLNLDF